MHYGINFHHNLAKFRPAISNQSNNPIHTIITSTYCITVLHLSIEEAFIEPSTYHDWFKSVLCSYKLLKSLSTLHTRKAVFVKRLKHVLLCFKISWTIMVISFYRKKQRDVQRLSASCHQVIFLYLVPAAGIGMTAMRPTTCFPWDHRHPAHPPPRPAFLLASSLFRNWQTQTPRVPINTFWPYPASIALYYISLLSGLGNIA